MSAFRPLRTFASVVVISELPSIPGPVRQCPRLEVLEEPQHWVLLEHVAHVHDLGAFSLRVMVGLAAHHLPVQVAMPDDQSDRTLPTGYVLAQQRHAVAVVAAHGLTLPK